MAPSLPPPLLSLLPPLPAVAHKLCVTAPGRQPCWGCSYNKKPNVSPTGSRHRGGGSGGTSLVSGAACLGVVDIFCSAWHLVAASFVVAPGVVVVVVGVPVGDGGPQTSVLPAVAAAPDPVLASES
eukprot:GHVU01221271.1.p2 GENE.GHVU01221271.1~~GHVU01221271.1.p2  ORF type:complete len:139 (+),score=4.36 GHVU01221271.1:40-417(+)